MTLINNLSITREYIAQAYQASNQKARKPTLIAVSKTKPVADIIAAWNYGQRDFGENKVQEAQKKFLPLRDQGLEFKLHLIGPLQTNKAADAVALFDVIHTVDRLKLALALHQAMQKQQRYPDLLVQVNTGNEPQKAGVLPNDATAFVQECLQIGLPIKGLMCIPPINVDPEPHFAWLASLACQLRLSELSMGMSKDYTQAIRYNATYVRIGSAIFGDRE